MRALIDVRTLESPRDRTAVRHRATDAPMAASIQQLIRTLHCTPVPRWRYDDAKHAGRLRYRPADGLLALIDGAIDQARREGRELPREDAHAPLQAMSAYIDARLDRHLPPLVQLVRDETRAEGAANEAELLLMQPNPARVELERAREAIAVQRRHLADLDERIAQELARAGRMSA